MSRIPENRSEVVSASLPGCSILFTMQCAEIELKFPIASLGQLQSRLPGLGFRLDTPRTFEQNTLYDTAERTLRASKQILRIRRYGDLWTLTHKRKPAASPMDEIEATSEGARYKVRIETETHIEDGPALAAVFGQLGYLPVFRYEKFRTEWSQLDTTIVGPLFGNSTLYDEASIPLSPHLVIDETPVGDYAELEGPPEWIDRTLTRLEVDPATCLTASYGRLFLDWKQRTGATAENLTFDEIRASTLEPALPW